MASPSTGLHFGLLLEVLPIQQGPRNANGEYHLLLLLDWGVDSGDRHREGPDLMLPTVHLLVGEGPCLNSGAPPRKWISKRFATRSNRCLSAPISPGPDHEILSKPFVVLHPIRTQTLAPGSRLPTHQVTTVHRCNETLCCHSSRYREIRPFPHSLPSVC